MTMTKSEYRIIKMCEHIEESIDRTLRHMEAIFAQASEPASNKEPKIRSRIFFKENLSQKEPVIRSREISQNE